MQSMLEKQPADESAPSAVPVDWGAPVRVLLVSPLPPPMGGISTWTQILKERGLPQPFEFEIVDTRVDRSHPDASVRLNLVEVKRALRILRKIHRSLRCERFSVMHLNCSLTYTATPRNLASALLAMRAKVPYVAHLRGTFNVPRGNDPASLFYRWAYRTLFNGAAAILALGLPSYRSIVALGNFGYKTISLMPNFVNFRAVPKQTPRGEGKECIKVVFTGALIKAKGTFTIVEVAERLPRARFALIGDAADESRMQLSRLIRERGLENRVHVSGPFSNQEIPAMLAENDVFLFPSESEAFPNSVAEAMAVGLPVVASPVGAIPEMIDVPEGGYLAAPDDVAGYVEMLTRLRDSPSLREQMGQYNRQKALREYDYDVVARKLCDIYARITKGCVPDV